MNGKKGQNFFDNWTWFNDSDPTDGLVTYVDVQDGLNSSTPLGYINTAGHAIMKVDNSTNLALNVPRRSVRIFSNQTWQGGLIIMDAVHAPFGCATWPAFW